jgi:hypothetical protein
MSSKILYRPHFISQKFTKALKIFRAIAGFQGRPGIAEDITRSYANPHIFFI